MMPVREGLQHLIVLLAQLRRRRFVKEGVPHEDAYPFYSHPIREVDKVRHADFRSLAGEAAQMTVKVPDHMARTRVKSSLGTDGHQKRSICSITNWVPC